MSARLASGALVALIFLCSCSTGLAAAATAYRWNPTCNGQQGWYSPSMSKCFIPVGIPTLQDTLTFPTGSNVTFNSAVGGSAYNAIMTQAVTIELGAEVTFVNGMLVVDHNITVFGTLNFIPNGLGSCGGGPLDDGINRPVPDYAMPGFTPNIIGKNQHFGYVNTTGVQTTMYIEGTVYIGMSGGEEWYALYPAIFINIHISLKGNLTAIKAYLFGEIHNHGIFNVEALYVSGTFNNAVSGRAQIDALFSPPLGGSVGIINNGHLSWNGWYQDHLSASIRNFGTLLFTEKHNLERHADGSKGEREIRGPIDNRGQLILETKGIRSDRFKFVGIVENSGTISADSCGIEFSKDLANRGKIELFATSSAAANSFCTFDGRFHNTASGALDARNVLGIIFRDVVSNSEGGVIRIVDARTLDMQKDVQNSGTMDLASRRIDFSRDLRNSGNVTVKHLGTNIFIVEGDVVNEGMIEIGATHASLKRDLFNAGVFAVRDTKPQRTRCFVEGRTYSTGDFSLQHAHLTVTTLLQHGDSSIDLTTATSTMTLGTWGTSLQRGVARGYLRRETAEDAQCETEVSQQQPPQVPQLELGPGPASCIGTISCSQCCPDSELCMVYSDNVYCDGYNTFEVWQAEPQVQRYMLSESTVAQMPEKMKTALGSVKFSHPHVFSGGNVSVKGPGAMTTTDTIDVQGRLELDNGAELFSMVEHSKGLAEGNGHIVVHHCSKWFLGNSAEQTSQMTPTITVRDGGSLVIPRHAEVTLGAGHVHVHEGGHVHVDGMLKTGHKFELHAAEGFRTTGTGDMIQGEK